MAFSARHMTVMLAILIGLASLLLTQAGIRGQEQGAPPGEAVEVDGGKTYAAERLIVTYEPGVSEAVESGVVEEIGGKVEDDIEPVNAEVVEVPAAEAARPGEDRKDALRQARRRLEGEPGVRSVDYDYLREATYTPNDPRFSRQWGLRKSRFAAAWDMERGRDSLGRGARIAVVDNGISAAHREFWYKIAAQRDFVNDDPVAQDSSSGHGTHVAGIAAASTGNGAGIAGGCPNCRLLVAKVMTNDMGHDSNIIDGIVWSADNGAKVINLSFGGPEPSDALRAAVDYAWDRGAVVVAAAGNSGGNVADYPAAYPNAIAVAATDGKDRRAGFSSYGDYVDVAAPGVDILSAVPGRGYDYRSGTSMATPHVGALAALLAARGDTNSQVRSRIVATATDLGARGRDPYYGAGRINAAKALQ